MTEVVAGEVKPGDGQQAPVVNAPWYGTPDAETLGLLQTHGWDKLTPDKAALEIAKSFHETQKLVGAPKDQIIRIPPKEDVQSWNEVYQRLGRPAKAEEYDFSIFKDTQGQPLLDEKEVGVLRDLSFKLNLTKEGATLLVQKLAEISTEEAKQESATGDADRAKQLDTLKNNWSANANANRVVADNAARALGLDPALLDTKGAPVTIPYAQAQEMFRQIGSKIGEDRFVNPGNASQNTGPMSKEQAEYRMGQLTKDAVWVDKYEKGDAVTIKEFNDLTRMIAGA